MHPDHDPQQKDGREMIDEEGAILPFSPAQTPEGRKKLDRLFAASDGSLNRAEIIACERGLSEAQNILDVFFQRGVDLGRLETRGKLKLVLDDASGADVKHLQSLKIDPLQSVTILEALPKNELAHHPLRASFRGELIAQYDEACHDLLMAEYALKGAEVPGMGEQETQGAFVLRKLTEAYEWLCEITQELTGVKIGGSGFSNGAMEEGAAAVMVKNLCKAGELLGKTALLLTDDAAMRQRVIELNYKNAMASGAATYALQPRVQAQQRIAKTLRHRGS